MASSPRIPIVLVAGALALGAAAPEPAPADLRLEWRAASGPVRGREGETVDLPYLLRNVGGRDAFAAVLEARTALGRAEGPTRVHPGPKAGSALARALRLTLARGMREVCIEAWLQTIEPTEPGDPRPEDNRICRAIEVQPAPGSPADAPRRPDPGKERAS